MVVFLCTTVTGRCIQPLQGFLTMGVYTRSDLHKAVEVGRLKALSGFKKGHVDVASIDLGANGDEMYQVTNLIRPRSQEKETVRGILPFMGARRVSFGDELVPGREYLFRATLEVNFSPGMYGYLNAKSTSGRNFLLVRTIADEHGWFDTVDKRLQGFSGEIWIAVQPLAHGIYLTEGDCYNQLRIFDGDTRFGNEDLKHLLANRDLLFRRDKTPYKQGELSLFSNDGSVFCTLYAKAEKLVGFRLKKAKTSICLTDRGLDPEEFFEPLYADSKECIFLRAGEMYLLSTNEMLNVPKDLCAELRALDPRLGLFFSHFAGFVDPGFFGTITLEVLAPFDMVLRHKDPVARLEFEQLKGETDSYEKAGAYHGQIVTQLPKQFQIPGKWIDQM